MDKYRFEFDPKSCNSKYFKELHKLMNTVNPKDEEFLSLTKKKLDSYKIGKCTYPLLKNCKPDEFFFDNKKQILLGRFYDTAACFYDCKENFFIFAVDPFSLFKNDLFIRYMIKYPELFIKREGSTILERVFPIRIILSTKHLIPSYKDKKMTRIEEFTSELLKPPEILEFKAAMNTKILNKFYKLNSSNILKKRITDNAPISHVVSREICILYGMDLYFYIVEEDNGKYLPFILISKYNMNQIIKEYIKANKPIPNIKLYFHKKSSKKVSKKSSKKVSKKSSKKVSKKSSKKVSKNSSKKVYKKSSKKVSKKSSKKVSKKSSNKCSNKNSKIYLQY
jgi:hypothetical protein